MPNYTPAFEQLSNGSVIESIDLLYTEAWGGPWWILLIWVVVLFMIYIRTRSDAAVAVFGIAGSLFLLPFFRPEASPVLYVIIVISLARLLWRFAGRGD